MHQIRLSCAALSALALVFLTPLAANADVWIPPWGESLYDSTFFTITYSDTGIDVRIETRMAARKFVSDDYLLTWSRTDSAGYFQIRDSRAAFSDSIANAHFGSFDAAFIGLSRCLLEDTVTFALTTRLFHPVSDTVLAPHWLSYRQNLLRRSGDPAWGEFGEMPPYDDPTDWYVRVVSNRDVTVEANGERRSGRDVVFTGRMGPFDWRMAFGCAVFLSGNSSYRDQVTDEIAFELTPEVRMEVPDIIVSEDVRIGISTTEPRGAWHYVQHAEISLNPGLAVSLAPMYLWYPNDQTEAVVRLKGFQLSGAWGHDIERWQDVPADIRVVEGEGRQSGFFIRIPSLANQVQGQRYWHWTDVRLQVDIDQGMAGQESARFILITAPLDYSRIVFTITRGWEVGFTRWENPFDDFAINGSRTILILRGLAAEPGVAEVWWGPVAVPVTLPETPLALTLDEPYPNPFNRTTSLAFSLPDESDVRLTAFDLTGRAVIAIDQGRFGAGTHQSKWDASGLESGIYLIRLEAGGEVRTAKAVVVK